MAILQLAGAVPTVAPDNNWLRDRLAEREGGNRDLK